MQGDWYNEDIRGKFVNISQYLSTDVQAGIPFFAKMANRERPLRAYLPLTWTTLSVGGGLPDPWLLIWIEWHVYLRFRFSMVDVCPAGYAAIIKGQRHTAVGPLRAYDKFGIEYSFYWSPSDVGAFILGVVPLERTGPAMSRLSVGWHKR